MDWQIQLFSKQFDRKSFDCGVESLNLYLQTQASQEVKRKICAVYIAAKASSMEICGYYSLSATSAKLKQLPDSVRGKLPRYPEVPAFLIGRLAVSVQFQGEGVGKFLLLDALVRSLHLSSEVGASLMLVDAKDESAVRFYEKYGFQVLGANRLFLPMTTIAKMGE